MKNRYPRDMSGYGINSPKVIWPLNSRIAVQFVVNYEEGGENNILHGDQGSEAFLSEIFTSKVLPSTISGSTNVFVVNCFGAEESFTLSC